MNKLKMLLVIPPTLGCLSCASTGKSTMFGATSGAAFGATIGAVVDPGKKGQGRIKNAFVGGAIGALVGAASAYFIHKNGEEKEQRAYQEGRFESQRPKLGLDSSDPEYPRLMNPRVEERFVDDQVKGNIFIPAHFEFQIVEPARWSR